MEFIEGRGDEKIRNRVLAVCISRRKHAAKKKVVKATLRKNWGIVGDAHAGFGDRQVSFLAKKSIDKMKKKGANVEYGDFGENIVMAGINPMKLTIGQRLIIGKNAMVEIAKIGKDCVKPCAIYYSVGFCIMPQEGIFCKVVRSGQVKLGDKIRVIS